MRATAAWSKTVQDSSDCLETARCTAMSATSVSIFIDGGLGSMCTDTVSGLIGFVPVEATQHQRAGHWQATSGGETTIVLH